MADERADEFLDKYRALEEELNNRYGEDDRGYGSAVIRYLNDKESKPYREKLNICREIRNFLSHHSEIDGEKIIQPSESIIRFVVELTEFIRRPPLAVDYATPFANLLKTTRSQNVRSLMKKMERQGISHVPVIENGECIGVFSVSTVFNYFLISGGADVNDDMRISDFEEFLPVEKHITEKFRFVGRDISLYDVRAEFERKVRGAKKLAAVFITDNGSSHGRILGMITPWDVIND